MGLGFTALGLIIASVVLLTLVPANIIFLWISLMLLAGTVITIQICVLLIKFLANKKIHIIPHIIVFICT